MEVSSEFLCGHYSPPRAPLANAARAGFTRLAPKKTSASVPILCGAGYAVFPFLAPAKSEGMERRAAHPYSSHALRRARVLRSTRSPLGAPLAARVPALAKTQAPGPRFLGRGIGASPSPAGSLRRGHSAPRSGPRASRERGYESRPQAPHFAPSSKRLAKTPSMSKARRVCEGSVAELWNLFLIMDLAHFQTFVGRSGTDER
jgi:hypothetical protein